jgi:hypothetical protein
MKDYKGEIAISYARASLGKQGGQEHSTDRQLAESVKYCEQNGLKLDSSYSFVDEGVSGFRGKNYSSEEGMLAQFQSLVESGAFPNGVHLIVEKLDRLYRDKPRKALMHFLNLLDKGVTIHSIIDNYVYEPESENDQEQLLISVVRLCASHDYSKTLSQRQILSREQRIEIMKKEKKFKPVGASASWIYRNDKDCQGYITDENREKIITMFELCNDGKSLQQIADYFNEREILNFHRTNPKPFNLASVRNTLRNDTVLGYYKAGGNEKPLHFKHLEVIAQDTFNVVQESLSSRTSIGRLSKDGNIFTGLIKCGCCLKEQTRGSKYLGNWVHSTLDYKGRSRHLSKAPPVSVVRPRRYYKCRSGVTNSKNCTGNLMDYYAFEDAFFAFLKELPFESLIDTDTKVQIKIFQDKLLSIRGNIQTLKKKEKNWELAIESLDDDPSSIGMLAKNLTKVKAELEEELINEQKQKDEIARIQDSQKEIIGNEKEIKQLIDKAYIDHEWMAFEELRISLTDKRGSEAVLETNHGLSEKEENQWMDMNTLWNFGIEYQKVANDPELSNKPTERQNQLDQIIKDWDGLRNKYFAEEIKKDEEGHEFKSKLAHELRKIIKEIKLFPYGFPQHPPSKAKANPGKTWLSCEAKHRIELNDWIENHLGEDSLSARTKELLKKEKAGNKIKQIDIQNLFATTKKTLRKWKDLGMPNVLEGAKVSQVLKWYEKANKSKQSSQKKRTENETLSRFMGFSVEFTDLCTSNTTKLVVPYWKNPTIGQAIEYNTEKKEMRVLGQYGDQRNEFIHDACDYFLEACSLMSKYGMKQFGIDELAPRHKKGVEPDELKEGQWMFFSATDASRKFFSVDDDVRKKWLNGKDWKQHKKQNIFSPENAKKDYAWLKEKCQESIEPNLLSEPPETGSYAVIYFVHDEPIRFMIMPDKEYQKKQVAKNLQKEIDKLRSGKLDLSKVGKVKPSPLSKVTQPLRVSKRNKQLKADPKLREKEQAKTKKGKNK